MMVQYSKKSLKVNTQKGMHTLHCGPLSMVLLPSQSNPSTKSTLTASLVVTSKKNSILNGVKKILIALAAPTPPATRITTYV